MLGSLLRHLLSDGLHSVLYIEPFENPSKADIQLSLIVDRGCDFPYFVVTNLPEIALL